MNAECKVCECRLGESCGYPAWLCCDACTHLSDHVGSLSGLLRGMARRAVAAQRDRLSWVKIAIRAHGQSIDLVDANARLGEAQTAIGMALGLDPPRTGKTWGAPEILARIAELGAQAERVRGRLRELTAMETRAREVATQAPRDAIDDAGSAAARYILGEAGDG